MEEALQVNITQTFRKERLLLAPRSLFVHQTAVSQLARSLEPDPTDQSELEMKMDLEKEKLKLFQEMDAFKLDEDEREKQIKLAWKEFEDTALPLREAVKQYKKSPLPVVGTPPAPPTKADATKKVASDKLEAVDKTLNTSTQKEDTPVDTSGQKQDTCESDPEPPLMPPEPPLMSPEDLTRLDAQTLQDCHRMNDTEFAENLATRDASIDAKRSTNSALAERLLKANDRLAEIEAKTEALNTLMEQGAPMETLMEANKELDMLIEEAATLATL